MPKVRFIAKSKFAKKKNRDFTLLHSNFSIFFTMLFVSTEENVNLIFIY